MSIEEFPGHWWIAADPDHRVPGTLEFSHQDGLKLNLVGILDEKKANTPLGVNILGESAFGEEITVYQAFYTGSSRVGSGAYSGTSSFIAQRAFVGHHFETMDDTKFISVSYHPTHLDEWLGIPILDFKLEGCGFSLQYSRPDSMVFIVPDDITIRILFTSSGPQIASTVTRIDFEHKAYLSIEIDEEKHFSHFGELIFHLNNFFALAAMEAIHPLELEGVTRVRDKETDKPEAKSIRILQPLFNIAATSKVHRFHMLFKFDDVKNELEQYLNNWFSKRSSLDPVFDLYFGVLHNTHLYPVTTFLNYAQALETYHIRTMNNEVDPPKLHKKRVNEILDAVPEKYKEWVEQRISFGNYPTFAQRLKEVIELNPRVVTGMAGSHEEFVKKVRNSRNYYTHYNPDLERKAEKGGYLKGTSMVLGSLLEGIILIEIGFPRETVEQMQRHRKMLPSIWY